MENWRKGTMNSHRMLLHNSILAFMVVKVQALSKIWNVSKTEVSFLLAREKLGTTQNEGAREPHFSVQSVDFCSSHARYSQSSPWCIPNASCRQLDIPVSLSILLTRDGLWAIKFSQHTLVQEKLDMRNTRSLTTGEVTIMIDTIQNLCKYESFFHYLYSSMSTVGECKHVYRLSTT